MGLLKWLRHRLREWLLDDFEGNNDLEVIIEGNIERASAIRVAGLQLVCLIRSTKRERLIGPAEARSESRFWDIWSDLAGSQLSWEDGSPCHPEEIDLT